MNWKKIKPPHRASAVRVGIVLFAVSINLFVLNYEQSLEIVGNRQQFLSGKLALILLSASVIPVLWYRPFSIFANFTVGNSLLGVTAFSALHRPGYLLGFFQTAIGITFLFHLPRWYYRATLLLWGGVFYYLLAFRWEVFPDAFMLQDQIDQVFRVLVFMAISLFVHYFFVEARNRAQEMDLRFASIGKRVSSILHDLKGLLSAPKLYLDLIEREKASISPEFQEILTGIGSDLQKIQAALLTLNRIAVSDGAKPTVFEASEEIERVKLLLTHRLRGRDFSLTGKAEIRMNRGDFASIIMNALVNSLIAFRERKKEGRLRVEIRIHSAGNGNVRVAIADSAGGFEPRILEALKQGQIVSGFREGTGLGTTLMREALNRVSGRLDFKNNDQGAEVVFEIPDHQNKKAVRAWLEQLREKVQ